MANAEELIINLKAVMDINDIKSNVNQIQNVLSKLKLPEDLGRGLSKNIEKVGTETEKAAQLMEKGFTKASDVSKLDKSLKAIDEAYKAILQDVGKIDNDTLQKALTFDTGPIADLQKQWDKLKASFDEKIQTSGLEEVKKQVTDINTVSKSKQFGEFLKQFQAGNIEGATTALQNLSTNMKSFGNETFKNSAGFTDFITNIDNLTASLSKGDLDTASTQLKTLIDSTNNIPAGNEKIKTYAEAIQNLLDHLKQLSSGDVGLGQIINDLQEIGTSITAMKSDQIDRVATSMHNVGNSAETSSAQVRTLSQSLLETARSQADLNNQISQLTSRAMHFTSLINGVQLFKRAIREAWTEVKALDEAMTETAVVTDFSVGDMWDKLPEYTDVANKYGSTIEDAYKVMTIFYQQGLETNQVFEIGAQTMQMARIAGLDYADAADKMTNALRGFNMELNETSAQKVNDVYSKLAAISASDTNELATAMTKVASLANSANMEFENTAAFLAQMIETTRESAETAGTALKTVVARFAEVKGLYNEGDLIGDVDGEEVDINKVGTALRAAGIDLNEFMIGAKGLDDILLELSGKWDSLDLLTQRYIATMAAGSRQQSRFLALMSDNARLTELTGAAYNAQGASAEQFAKTQESLETKINKLKNAWDEFIMGLANAGTFKKLIDLLTSLLTHVNNILDGFEKLGKVGEIGRSVASIGLLTGAFLGLKKALDSILIRGAKVIGIFNEQGANSFKKGAKNIANLASGAAETGTNSAEISSTEANTQAQKRYIDTIKEKIGIQAQDSQVTKEAAMATAEKAQAQLQSAQMNLEEAQTAQLSAAAELTKAEANQAVAVEEYKKIAAQKEELLTKKEKIASEIADLQTKEASGEVTTQLAIKVAELNSIENQLKTTEDQLSIAHDKVMGASYSVTNAYNAQAAAARNLKNAETGVAEAQAASKAASKAAKSTTSASGGILSILTNPYIAATIAAITALVGVGYAIYKYTKSGQEEINGLKTASEGFGEAVDSADQAVTTLTNDWQKLTDNKNSLDGLIEGTNEWHQKLLDINNTVLEMIELFSTFGIDLDVTMDDNGMLSIDQTSYSTGMAQILDKQRSMIAKQNQTKAVSDYEQKAKDLEDNYNKEIKDLASDDKIIAKTAAAATGGAATGLAGGIIAGMTAGFFAGTAIPGAGNIAGMILGGIIGGVIGAVGGGTAAGVAEYNNALNKKEQERLKGIYDDVQSGKRDINDLTEDEREAYYQTQNNEYQKKLAYNQLVQESEQSLRAEYGKLYSDAAYKLAAKDLATAQLDEGDKLTEYKKQVAKNTSSIEWNYITGKPFRNFEIDDEELKHWAEDNGYKIDTGEKKVYNSKGEEVDYKNKTDEILTNEAYRLYSQDMKNKLNAFQDLDKNTSDQVLDYMNGYYVENIEALDKMSNIWSALGEDFSEAKVKNDNILTKQREALKLVLKQDEIKGLTNEQTTQMLKTLDKAKAKGINGSELSDLAEDLLNNEANLKEYSNQLSDVLDEIPNSAIQGAQKIREFLSSANEDEKKIAELAQNSKKYNAAAQINEFMSGTASTEEWQTAFDKARENGKITAKSIGVLSKEFSDLDMMLKDNSITTGGLAMVMEKLQTGELKTKDITEDLIKAFNKLTSTETALANTTNRFNGENIRDSQIEANSTNANSYYQAAKDIAKRGAYGDEQFYDYMNILLGTDDNGKNIWDNILKENNFNIEKAYNEAKKQLDYEGSGTSIFFNQLVNKQNELTEGWEDLYTVSNGKINFDFSKVISSGKTTTEAIKEAMNISLEQAESIASYMSLMSPTFKAISESIDTISGTKDLLTNNTLNVGNNAYVLTTQQQLNSWQADFESKGLYDSSTDGDFSEFLKKFYNFGEGKNTSFIDISEIDFGEKDEVASTIREGLIENSIVGGKAKKEQNWTKYAYTTPIENGTETKMYNTIDDFYEGSGFDRNNIKSLAAKFKKSETEILKDIAGVEIYSGTTTIEYDVEANSEEAEEFMEFLTKGTATIDANLDDEWEADSITQQIANAIAAGFDEAQIAELLGSEFSEFKAGSQITEDLLNTLHDSEFFNDATYNYLKSQMENGVVDGLTAAQAKINEVNSAIAAYNGLQEANSLLSAIQSLSGVKIPYTIELPGDVVEQHSITIGNIAGENSSSYKGTTWSFGADGSIEYGEGAQEILNNYGKAMARISDDTLANGGSNGGGGGGSGDSEDPLDKQLEALKKGGIWTSLAQLKILEKQKENLFEQYGLQKKTLTQRLKEIGIIKDTDKTWIDLLGKISDGSATFGDVFSAIKESLPSLEDLDFKSLLSMPKDIIEEIKNDNGFGGATKELDDEFWEKLNKYDEAEFEIFSELIDKGTELTGKGIDIGSQLTDSAIQMVEAFAQAAIDGFNSYLGWLTMKIDDEHDIEQLDSSLSNIVDRLAWEYDKLLKRRVGYDGTDTLNEKELFENSNQSAKNIMARMQNQRRLYENSFRQLEDLGLNISSELTEAFEKLYDQLYGANGPFTRLNKSINRFKGQLEDVFPSTSKFLGEAKGIVGNLFQDGKEKIDGIFEKIFPSSIFNDLIDNFTIDGYQLGDFGKEKMQKLIELFTELTPSFNADYQIANKSELVDALNQKMSTIITNDTITAQFVQGYLDYLTEVESQMESEVENIRNSESQILELYDNLTEILERGKEEYSELGQDLYTAITDEKNSLLEELQALHDSITAADEDILNTLRNNLELIRQQRENDKTEQDLQAKEARLAYLRQDTTGANLQEIKKLEKELEDGQESYTDKLIDQKISELEKQNTDAADQRQIQIDLLQEEINNTEGIWETVEKLLSGISKFDHYLTGEIDREGYKAVIEQLKKGQSYLDSSSTDKEQSEKDWDAKIRAASLYRQVKDNLSDEYNYLKLASNIIDRETGLPEEYVANGGWNNYVAFSTLETTVDKSNQLLQEAITAVNNLVEKITVSYDDEQSLHMKATYYGGLVQAVSGTESAAKAAIEDLASGAPEILNQLTEGTGNMTKGFLKLGLSVADTSWAAIVTAIKSNFATGGGAASTSLGNVGEGLGFLMEGISNYVSAAADAASLGMQMAGDMAPGITDIGVALATALKETFFNDYEKVEDDLIENIDVIVDKLGNTLGTSGYLKEIKDAIKLSEKIRLGQPDDENSPIYDALTEMYQDLLKDYRQLENNENSKTDVEGYNKLYLKATKLREMLNGMVNYSNGFTEEVNELDPAASLETLQKWRGEIGSLFKQIDETVRGNIISIVNGIMAMEGKTLGESKISRWIDIYDGVMMSDVSTQTLQRLAVAMEEFEPELSNKLYKLYNDRWTAENTPQETFFSFWSNKVTGIWGDVQDFFDGFWNKITQSFQTVVESITGKNYGDSWIGKLNERIDTFIDKLKSGSLLDAIKELFDSDGDGKVGLNEIIETIFGKDDNDGHFFTKLGEFFGDLFRESTATGWWEIFKEKINAILANIKDLNKTMSASQAKFINEKAHNELSIETNFNTNTAWSEIIPTILKKFPTDSDQATAKITNFINALNNALHQTLWNTLQDKGIIADLKDAYGIEENMNSYATGGSIRRSQTALVGEAGTELIQHARGGATLATSPSMAKLEKGDVVYNAKQTKDILKGGGLDFSRFAEGTVSNFMLREPSFGYSALKINFPDFSETNKESTFNLNLNLEDLTVDSVDRVEEVAERVMDKINTTISGAMWPYNRL